MSLLWVIHSTILSWLIWAFFWMLLCVPRFSARGNITDNVMGMCLMDLMARVVYGVDLVHGRVVMISQCTLWDWDGYPAERKNYLTHQSFRHLLWNFFQYVQVINFVFYWFNKLQITDPSASNAFPKHNASYSILDWRKKILFLKLCIGFPQDIIPSFDARSIKYIAFFQKLCFNLTVLWQRLFS